MRKPPQIPFIRKLCSHLPEEEIEAAEERFMRYVAICRDIAKEAIEEKRKSDFDNIIDHP